MTTTTAPPTEAAATVRTWLSAFSDALALGGAEAVALFTQDCFWQDLFAFTWNIRTSKDAGKSPTCSLYRPEA